MDVNKLLTAVEHIATGAEAAAANSPSGNPHAMGWFARAKALIAEMRGEENPPPPAEEPADPADTSADAMNAGEAAALEQHPA